MSKPVFAEFAETVIATGPDPISKEAFPDPDTAAPGSTELSAIAGAEEPPEPLELGAGSTDGSLESRNVTAVEPVVYPVTDAAVAVTRHCPGVVKVKMPVLDSIAQSLMP